MPDAVKARPGTARRRGRGRRLLLASAIILATALAVTLPDRSGLPSRQATMQILDRLGMKWEYPGPPVILFYGPGCGDCQLQMELLDGQGVPYELVDGIGDATANQVLTEVTKDRFGRPQHVFTPTTIVGTRVIHGPDIKAVLKAFTRQHDWPESK